MFRAAAKMAKRRLASAFASWTNAAVRARLGRRAVARMGKRTMVHAFDRWRRTASASVAAEKTRADATARLIRQLFARRAAVKRFKMFAHWRRWASGSARSAKRLGDEMRAVLRSRFARRALDAWSDYAWEKATRRAEEKAARRFEGVGFAAEEKTKTEGEKGDSGRLFEKSSAAPGRSPARSLEKSAALDPGASGGATPNPNPNQPASFSSSSLANIAFEGWSAAAMVKTTVFRDPNEPAGDAEDSDSAAPDPDPEAASAAADPERLASAAAAAALSASSELVRRGRRRRRPRDARARPGGARASREKRRCAVGGFGGAEASDGVGLGRHRRGEPGNAGARARSSGVASGVREPGVAAVRNPAR